jgi:hypothetical protein
MEKRSGDRSIRVNMMERDAGPLPTVAPNERLQGLPVLLNWGPSWRLGVPIVAFLESRN